MAKVGPLGSMIVFLVVAAVYAPQAALAQGLPTVDISGAYQHMVDTSLAVSGMRRETSAQGWDLDVAFPINRRLSLVGSVDGSYGRESTPLTNFGGGTLVSSWADIDLLGGVRFGPTAPARVKPFFHILGGFLWSFQEDDYQTKESFGPFSSTENAVLLDLGAGASVMVSPRVGIRFGGDLRIDVIGVALQAYDKTMARVVAGIVFRIP